MDTETKRSDAKVSFNLEPDVQVKFNNWRSHNPHVIQTRMFNEALRVHLRPFKRAARKAVAA